MAKVGNGRRPNAGVNKSTSPNFRQLSALSITSVSSTSTALSTSARAGAMLPFSTLLLRSYYEAIGWNEDNLYSNITRSSSGA